MRVRIRYDTPDEDGVTRRERAARFADVETIEQPPDFEIPSEGEYLWAWFWTLSGRVRRVTEGVCSPVPPSEFLAWCEASGTIVEPVEYAILCAMDDVFCEETNKEIKDFRERQQERQKQEIEAAKRKR